MRVLYHILHSLNREYDEQKVRLSHLPIGTKGSKARYYSGLPGRPKSSSDLTRHKSNPCTVFWPYIDAECNGNRQLYVIPKIRSLPPPRRAPVAHVPCVLYVWVKECPYRKRTRNVDQEHHAGRVDEERESDLPRGADGLLGHGRMPLECTHTLQRVLQERKYIHCRLIRINMTEATGRRTVELSIELHCNYKLYGRGKGG